MSSQVALAIAIDIKPPDHSGPLTGFFQTLVKTVLPSHTIFCGVPTFTDNSDVICLLEKRSWARMV
jgi:hypothetical protein